MQYCSVFDWYFLFFNKCIWYFYSKVVVFFIILSAGQINTFRLICFLSKVLKYSLNAVVRFFQQMRRVFFSQYGYFFNQWNCFFQSTSCHVCTSLTDIFLLVFRSGKKKNLKCTPTSLKNIIVCLENVYPKDPYHYVRTNISGRK